MNKKQITFLAVIAVARVAQAIFVTKIRNEYRVLAAEVHELQDDIDAKLAEMKEENSLLNQMIGAGDCDPAWTTDLESVGPQADPATCTCGGQMFGDCPVHGVGEALDFKVWPEQKTRRMATHPSAEKVVIDRTVTSNMAPNEQLEYFDLSGDLQWLYLRLRSAWGWDHDFTMEQIGGYMATILDEATSRLQEISPCVIDGEHLKGQPHRWQECPTYHEGRG